MLQELFDVIEERKRTMPEKSYTASLMRAGEDEIVKKVGEEAIEVILAAKGQGDQRLAEEIADLFYHILVLLSYRGLTLEDIARELEKRR
jgi:phosphoribosyl-ATP pyrophosphohydrolase